MNNTNAVTENSGNETKAPAIELLAHNGFHSPSQQQLRLVRAITSGKDLVIQGTMDRSRSAALAAAMLADHQAGSKPRVAIVAGSSSQAGTMSDQLGSIAPSCSISRLGSGSDDVSGDIVGGSIDDLQRCLDANPDFADTVGTIVVFGADTLPAERIGEFVSLVKDKAGSEKQVVLQAETVSPELSGVALEHLKFAQTLTLQRDESTSKEVEHVYYEVGSDLLDKTNALCDLLEVEQSASSIVFCNNRSDAELVDVILKKRGLRVIKVDDETMRGALTSAMRSIRGKESDVLVITDMAAGDLEVDDFDLVVNYSIHSEPEVYLHRIARSEDGSKLKKVMSLVGPLDYSNFHFIKKVAGLEFHKLELPSRAAVFASRLESLAEEAGKANLLADDNLGNLVKLTLEHDSKEQIIATLLHNTINVLPSLQRGSSSRRESGGERREGRDNRDNRDNRDDRRERGGRRRGERGERSRDRREGRNSRNGDSDRGRGRSSEPREDRVPLPPPQKDVRIYIGRGVKQGFSQEVLAKLASEHCELGEDQIKRFSIRDCYSYADVAEEIADPVIDKLSNVELDSGEKLFLKRATTITLPREKEAREEGEIDETEENYNSAPEGGEDLGSDEATIAD